MASGLLGFARHYWIKGEKEEAVETVDEAYEILKSQREIETRDRRARNGLLASIAAQYAGFGKTDRGIEIALENPDTDEQTAALSQIAQLQAVQKDDEAARETINLIGEDSNRLLALIALSDVREKAGERSTAVSLLVEAASLADTIPQLAPRSSVLNEISLRLVEYDESVKAREIAHENLNLISEIRDESNRAIELTKLSSVYEQSNFDVSDTERIVLEKLTRTV
jgi:hypothetical protein